MATSPVDSLSTKLLNRRGLIRGTTATVVSILKQQLVVPPAYSADDVPSASASTADVTVPKSKSVVVLGAGGGTGRECVKALLSSNRPCIATNRKGDFEYNEESGNPTLNPNLLSVAAADVTSPSSLSDVISSKKSNIGAVIFAASASTKGGDPSSVDREGVLNAARCCIANRIPRLVVVSSGTVTRPDSAVYKLLNFVGKGIMEEKMKGEDGLRELYADPNLIRRGLGYTVIRPGGLTVGESLGASALELNQGDDKSGRLARSDVAALCVNCLDSGDAFDATFECYNANTAKPVESVGFSNIMKSTDATKYVSGYERRGDTWEDLFRGLLRDKGHDDVA
eukprot:CAMPEP_0195519826 /NCGR_PEP_ID=MMETSP0794_2-20130614/15582_1 /TAXON_ID=515487 /ORGANISM="Stephanopyxis turris, Strain CCMP 815" /LENGTH=339 /DNA_ID=CAMNT_0040649051 /DNA_START=107 /DNA_END=1126 /DNA_ORIENTATION=+